MTGRLPDNFSSMHPIIICEGAFEHVVIDMLLARDCLVFPASNVNEITGIRSAERIQDAILAFDLEEPACILRLLDSRTERFELKPLYRSRYPVINIHTRPEIEMLAIIKEGKRQAYMRKDKGRVKPSDYCIDKLDLPAIKQDSFLRKYWTIGTLVNAIYEYQRVTRLGKDELCLADLLGPSAQKLAREP